MVKNMGSSVTEAVGIGEMDGERSADLCDFCGRPEVAKTSFLPSPAPRAPCPEGGLSQA